MKRQTAPPACKKGHQGRGYFIKQFLSIKPYRNNRDMHMCMHIHMCACACALR